MNLIDHQASKDMNLLEKEFNKNTEMKNIITITTLFVLTLNGLIAQTTTPTSCPPYNTIPITKNACENGNGIKTNPNNLVNNNCPELKNDFEWRVKHTPGSNIPNEFYIAYDVNGVVKGLRNPFNDDRNSEYRFLADNHNSNYHPEDGWEIIKVDFGAFSNINTGYTLTDEPGFNIFSGGISLPYMILYNKYSGTFRFFGALKKNPNYETIKIELRIPKRSPSIDKTSTNFYQDNLKATNLLSIQGESIQPLDQETNESVMVVFATANINDSKFFWFDIPVAYDPCLCNIRSQLDISFSIVTTANIKLNEVEAIKTAKNLNNYNFGLKVVSSVLVAGVGAENTLRTSGAIINFQAYKNLVGLIKTNPHSNLSQAEKENLTELENHLTCGSNFAKIIQNNYSNTSSKDSIKRGKAAIELIEANTTFLSSLSIGCAKLDNAGLVITDALRISGTWTETSDISGAEIILAMPGSNWSDKTMQVGIQIDNIGKTVPVYPTYNERLGTFAMLETPKVNLVSVSEETQHDWGLINKNKLLVKLSLAEDLKYTFNPLLNIDKENTIISCRYVGIDQKNLNVKYSFGSDKNNEKGLEFKREDHECKFSSFINNINNINVKYSNNSKYHLTSPFVPIDQFKNLDIVFYLDEIFNSTTNVNSGVNGNKIEKFIFVQYKITMTSNNIGKDGKKITAIYYFTYPIKLKTSEISVPRLYPKSVKIDQPNEHHNCDDYKNYFNNVFLPEVRNTFRDGVKKIFFEEKDFNTDEIFQNDEVLSFDGVVSISAKLSTASGKKVKIYSTIGFELDPGAEISPDIELIVGLPLDKVPQPPQTYSQVSDFCGNNDKYKAQTFSKSVITQEKQSIQVKLFPNPSSGNFTVSIFNSQAKDYSISLTDVTGKVIFTNTYNGSQTQQMIETNGLAKSIYFVSIRCGDTNKVEKLIIQNQN